MLLNELCENIVDLLGHICSIATNIKVGSLLKESVDFDSSLLEAVLDIDFLQAFSRESCDKLKFVAETFCV